MLEGAAAVGRVIIGIGLAARLTADHPFLGFRTVIGVIDMLRALDGAKPLKNSANLCGGGVGFGGECAENLFLPYKAETER